MPVTTFLNVYGLTDRQGNARSVNITVRAKTPAMMNEAIDHTRQILRTQLGVKPGEPDNFVFYNSASLISQFNKMSIGVKLAGFVIGTTALIVSCLQILETL